MGTRPLPSESPEHPAPGWSRVYGADYTPTNRIESGGSAVRFIVGRLKNTFTRENLEACFDPLTMDRAESLPADSIETLLAADAAARREAATQVAQREVRAGGSA